MNGGAVGPEGNLQRFYGYKETFGKDSVWVDIPQQRMYPLHDMFSSSPAESLMRSVVFVHTTNPYDDSQSPEPSVQPTDSTAKTAPRIATANQPRSEMSIFEVQSSTHGLEALSAVASVENYSYQSTLPHSGHQRSYSQSASHTVYGQTVPPSSSQDWNALVNQSISGPLSPQIDPRLQVTVSPNSRVDSSSAIFASQRYSPDRAPEDDEDIPFLLRYFSEGPGHWMDLFDLSCFIGVEVPVKASSCPLLLYAAVALAAKALGRLDRRSRKMGDLAPRYTSAQWLHKARKYYDLAVSLLRQALEIETRARSLHPSEGSMSSPRFGSDGDQLIQHLPRTDSDELVATTAILCVYEFLDASGSEWSRHLDGAKSLFDIAKDGTMPYLGLSPEPETSFSRMPVPSNKGRGAVFWNIVRQDMQDACECPLVCACVFQPELFLYHDWSSPETADTWSQQSSTTPPRGLTPPISPCGGPLGCISRTLGTSSHQTTRLVTIPCRTT